MGINTQYNSGQQKTNRLEDVLNSIVKGNQNKLSAAGGNFNNKFIKPIAGGESQLIQGMPGINDGSPMYKSFSPEMKNSLGNFLGKPGEGLEIPGMSGSSGETSVPNYSEIFSPVKTDNKPDEDDKFVDGHKLAEKASNWKNRHFHPGQTEQCANFVRNVIKEPGNNAGVTRKASDGWPTGPGFANSFAGDDIGKKISNKKDLKEGDIILFKNTYGNYRDGTITHVGIYTGNGKFVHRPTVNKPVKELRLEDFGHFSQARRLYK